jgi:YfiH family protein
VFLDRVRVGPAQLAFTDRHGGISGGRFESLDFGSADGQRRDDLATNRARLAEAIGRSVDQLVFVDQVHGRDVAVVDRRPSQPPVADALVTATPGLALVIRVADCVPVLLVDPTAGVIGAAHAGRRGAVEGVVPATVAAMVGLGAQSDRIVARLGPSICGGCYEVPLDLQQEVAARLPAAASTTTRGTPAIDVPGAVESQLLALHITPARVGVCTHESADLFSFRRDHPTGRSVGVVWLDPMPTTPV